jgi:hypothetical protein
MICLIGFYLVPTEKYNEMNPTLLAYHHHAVMPIFQPRIKHTQLLSPATIYEDHFIISILSVSTRNWL